MTHCWLFLIPDQDVKENNPRIPEENRRSQQVGKKQEDQNEWNVVENISNDQIKNKRDECIENDHYRVTDHSSSEIIPRLRPEIQFADRAKCMHVSKMFQMIWIRIGKNGPLPALRTFHLK
jgi:hypothetical protein